MRIAVTGATGFLGRYLVRHLADAGHRLHCWHRPGSDRSGFEDLADAIDWLPGELGEEAAAASWSAVPTRWSTRLCSGRGPQPRRGSHGAAVVFFGVNLTGSLQLFQAAFAAGVPRFVFVSDLRGPRGDPRRPPARRDPSALADQPLRRPQGGAGEVRAQLRPRPGLADLRPAAHRHLRPGPSAADSRWYDLVGQVLRGEPVASPKGGKEVHAADVARAVELLLHADAKAIAGQAFNCYDRYVAEQEVARIAKELTGSPSEIADLNRGPKNQIETEDPHTRHDLRRRAAAAPHGAGTGRGLIAHRSGRKRCAGPPGATPAAGEVPMGCQP